MPMSAVKSVYPIKEAFSLSLYRPFPFGNVLNRVLIVSTLLLMLKLFFKTPGASNPSSHTRTDSTDHNYPKSFTKLVAGTTTIFTFGKRREDFTTGKRDILRPFRNMITLLQLLITLKQLVTTSNGTILTFWHPARLTTTVKLRRPCLFKSYRASIECQCQQ